MDHISLPKNLILVDIEPDGNDQFTQVSNLLGSHFANQGEIFRSDHKFYQLETDEDLQASGQEICQWLAIKPSHLNVRFDSQIASAGKYSEVTGYPDIKINSCYRQKPYECAAILVHLLIHYMLINKRRYVLSQLKENEKLVNLLIAHSGLGVVMINGYRRNISRTQRWLRQLSPPKFIAEELEAYIRMHRVPPESYAPHIANWSAPYLPKSLRTISRSSFKTQHIKLSQHQTRRLKLTIIISLVLVISALYLIIGRSV